MLWKKEITARIIGMINNLRSLIIIDQTTLLAIPRPKIWNKLWITEENINIKINVGNNKKN